MIYDSVRIEGECYEHAESKATIGWNSNAELSNDCILGIRHTDVMKITCIRLCRYKGLNIVRNV